MKVHEMITILKSMNPEHEVVIPVTVPYDAIGGTPTVKIVSIRKGFDWDNNTVQIYTDSEVVRFSDKQQQAFNDMKKESRLKRREEWKKRGGYKVDYDEAMRNDIEQTIHPLFKSEFKGK